MTSRGKDNIKIIEDINKSLHENDSELNAGGGIFLSKPYQFIEEQIPWWKEEEEEKGGNKWYCTIRSILWRYYGTLPTFRSLFNIARS